MKRLLAVLPVLLVALVAVTGTTIGGAESACATEDGVSPPISDQAKAAGKGQCVAPTDVMRREHMNFLYDQRDATLRQGRRGMKYSLQGCVECHAVPDPAASSLAAAEFRTVQPFCAACHEYASVSIDCFACHTEKTKNMTAKLDGLVATASDPKQMIEEMQAFLRSGSPPDARPGALPANHPVPGTPAPDVTEAAQ